MNNSALIESSSSRYSIAILIFNLNLYSLSTTRVPTHQPNFGLCLSERLSRASRKSREAQRRASNNESASAWRAGHLKFKADLVCHIFMQFNEKTSLLLTQTFSVLPKV